MSMQKYSIKVNSLSGIRMWSNDLYLSTCSIQKPASSWGLIFFSCHIEDMRLTCLRYLKNVNKQTNVSCRTSGLLRNLGSYKTRWIASKTIASERFLLSNPIPIPLA